MSIPLSSRASRKSAARANEALPPAVSNQRGYFTQWTPAWESNSTSCGWAKGGRAPRQSPAELAVVRGVTGRRRPPGSTGRSRQSWRRRPGRAHTVEARAGQRRLPAGLPHPAGRGGLRRVNPWGESTWERTCSGRRTVAIRRPARSSKRKATSAPRVEKARRLAGDFGRVRFRHQARRPAGRQRQPRQTSQPNVGERNGRPQVLLLGLGLDVQAEDGQPGVAVGFDGAEAEFRPALGRAQALRAEGPQLAMILVQQREGNVRPDRAGAARP